MGQTPVLTRLPDDVVARLQQAQLHLVATVDDDGFPSTTLMSWLVALSPTRLALCVDTRSRTFHNLTRRPAIALELLGDGITWGVKGRARVSAERMASPPFPCARVEVDVTQARDHSSPSTVFRGPRYDYALDKQHRRGLEERILEELREGGP